MNNNKTNFLNLIWAVFAKLFSGLKLALLGIIIARYLGPKDFGVFSYVISFVSLFSVLAEFRLQSILIRDFSQNNINSKILLGSSFRICLFFASIGYLALSFIVYMLNDDNNVSLFILIYGLSYFFQIFRFLKAFFVSRYLNKLIIRAEVIAAFIVLILGASFIYFKLSVVYFVVLRTLDVFVFSVLLIVLYTKLEGSIMFWVYDVKVRKKLVLDSYPLVLSSFAVIIFNKIDQVMLRYIIDDYAVGQYSAAVSITGIISFIPIVLSESISPSLISRRKRDIELYEKSKQSFSNILIWGSLVLSIIIMLLSPYIISILYGKDYHPAIAVMKVFAFKGLFVAMGAVAAQIMIIEAIHQLAYIKSIVGGIVNIVFNYVLISKIGIMGAVWASLLAFLLSSYLVHFFMKRYRYIFWIQTKSLLFGWYFIIRDIKLLMSSNTIKN